MSKDILLKIYTPSKKFLEKKVAKVSVPAYNGDLTVLIERAPSEILLKEGKVKVLDEIAAVVEEYQIGEGVADIAGNTCTIFTSFAEK